MGKNTLSDIAVNIRTIDRELLNIEFWRNPSQISSYAENILRYVKPELSEHFRVSVSFGRQAYCAWTNASWEIVLPQLPAAINLDSDKIEKLIYARTMFLKHEIGHAIWTKYGVPGRYHRFMNAVDDTRIETLFGNTFKGARRGFFDLRKVFFKNSKVPVETLEANEECFFTFARFTLAGFVFDKTRSTKFYEKLLNQVPVKNFFIEDSDKYFDFIKDYYDTVVEPAFRKLEQEVEQPSKNSSKKEEEKNDLDEPGDSNSSEENEDSENSEESEDSEDSGNSNSSEESDEEDEEEEDNSVNSDKTDEESEDNTDDNKSQTSSDSDDEEDDKISSDDLDSTDEGGEKVNGDESSKDETNDIDETQQAEDYVQEQEENPEVNQEDSGNKDFSKTVNHQNNGDNVKSAKDDDDEPSYAEEMIEDDSLTSYDGMILDNVQLTAVSVDDLMTHEFKPKEFFGATIVDLKHAIENCSIGVKIDKDGKTGYSRVVNNHKKTILETLQFLSLKLQNKTRIKALDNQLEGNLDQKNIVDILINKDLPRAFYKNIKVNKIDNTLHLLIDNSGSMRAHEFKTAMSNAIILFEICQRMKINIGVYLFSSFISTMTVKKNKQGSTSLMKKVFPYNYKNFALIQRTYGSTFEVINRIEGETDGMLFVIKAPDEQTQPIHYKILGTFYDKKPHNLSSGTPEFEAVTAVVKKYNMPGRNMLFIINDGGYDDGFSRKVKVSAELDLCKHLEYCDGQREHVLSATKRIKTELEAIVQSKDLKIALLQYANKYSGRVQMTDVEKVYQNFLEIYQEIADDEITTKIGMLRLRTMQDQDNLYSMRIDCISNDENEKNTVRLLSAAVSDLLQKKYHHGHIMYKSIIQHMRSHMNWKIFGIGIQSAIGKAYIGDDNFIYIKSAEELETLFSKKLKQIY